MTTTRGPEPGPASPERHDVAFDVAPGERCSGWLYLPAGVERPPIVVLGHGLGATRDMRLDAYCERFAAAGIAALAFTYRGFGDSGGSDRQRVSVDGQLADWEAALSFARAHPAVDGSRMAVWGTSFGGGHAITMAGRHPELVAAVTQCPFTDGQAAVAAQGAVASLRASAPMVKDVLARAVGRPPARMRIAAPPGERALMDAPDALPGYLALVPDGGSWVNEVQVRSVLDILRYRPGRSARRVQIPILFCVSVHDSVAPAGPTIKYARQAPKGEILEHPAGHFDFYLGEAFETLVEHQLAFLKRHLAGADRWMTESVAAATRGGRPPSAS